MREGVAPSKLLTLVREAPGLAWRSVLLGDGVTGWWTASWGCFRCS